MPVIKPWSAKNVRRIGDNLYYRPRIPAHLHGLIPTDKSGKLKPPIRLGTINDPHSKLASAYRAAVERIEAMASATDNRSLFHVAQLYLNSEKFQPVELVCGFYK